VARNEERQDIGSDDLLINQLASLGIRIAQHARCHVLHLLVLHGARLNGCLLISDDLLDLVLLILPYLNKFRASTTKQYRSRCGHQCNRFEGKFRNVLFYLHLIVEIVQEIALLSLRIVVASEAHLCNHIEGVPAAWWMHIDRSILDGVLEADVNQGPCLAQDNSEILSHPIQREGWQQDASSTVVVWIVIIGSKESVASSTLAHLANEGMLEKLLVELIGTVEHLFH